MIILLTHSELTVDMEAQIGTNISDKYTSKFLDYCTDIIPYIEKLFVEVKLKNIYMTIATAYKPASASPNLFSNKLDELIISFNNI